MIAFMPCQQPFFFFAFSLRLFLKNTPMTNQMHENETKPILQTFKSAKANSNTKHLQFKYRQAEIINFLGFLLL